MVLAPPSHNQLILVFCGMFIFCYFAFIHATRKTLSTVKPSLIISWTHNTSSTDPLFPSAQAASEFLAMLDGGFLFAYSLVYIFGYVTEVFHIYSKTFYAFLWISGGFFQSVGWPTEVNIHYIVTVMLNKIFDNCNLFEKYTL
uniref:TLC domain-containing protein n=1 Tax=Heterorhabditis bacteriophora TaxID=37862 RepID=A0A1I7XS24_HETBA